MKTSLNWLKEFVNVDKYSIEELEKMLSLNIIEVEQIYPLVEATNLEVGYVKECVNHPDSDHLHVCQVELSDGVFQIVCGAPNVKENIKVIVARINAVLPGDFKIKKSSIRGVESNGMICSLQELGIEEKYIPEQFKDGIFIFSDSPKTGSNPLSYLGLDDTVIELGLTPNRGDLLSHLGVAYDLAAVLNQKIDYKKIELNEKGNCDVKVEVKSDKTKAYYARKVINIEIKESPWWLKSRLISCGIRPINNVVDITNYVMLELGQPLHAFDADKIGNTILVRNASNNEKTFTLDNIERTLDSNDIVITNGKEIIAIGGVMGGLQSSVSETTKSIILESAYFDPISIRKTSSKLQLHSESSSRFERKVDPSRVELAINLAAKLLEDLANGTVLKGISKYDILDKKDKLIKLELSKLNNYLGTSIEKNEVISIFNKLGFKTSDSLEVSVPSRRVDISNYQDLYEEVARIYGYNNIPITLPKTDSKGQLSKKQLWLRDIRFNLSSFGLNEVINYSLINSKDFNQFVDTKVEEGIKLLMPMTEEREILKLSLLNGILENIKYNRARQAENISIFEIGKIYNSLETTKLAIGITGRLNSLSWQSSYQQSDFFALKGIVNHLLKSMNIEAKYIKSTETGFHPGQTASILVNDTKIGVIGAIHPSIKHKEELDNTYLCEINLDELFNLLPDTEKFKSIPKYPTITRDLALIVDKNVNSYSMIELIKQTAKKLLSNVDIFDVYQGDKIEENKKSIAFKLTFIDEEKTLLSEDVDKLIKSILFRLEKEFNALLR